MVSTREIKIRLDFGPFTDTFQAVRERMDRLGRTMEQLRRDFVRAQALLRRQEALVRYHPALQRMTMKRRYRALTGRGTPR